MQGDKGDSGEVGFPGRRVSNFVDHPFKKFHTKLSLFKTKLKCIQKGTLSHNSWVLTN